MRGSSMPHSSSEKCRGSAARVGSESMRQWSMPLSERATVRWEWPRRSSTRHKRSVVPSGSKVAPGLKTLLIGYGQSAALKRGLALWRRKSSGCLLIIELLFLRTVMSSRLNEVPAPPANTLGKIRRLDFHCCDRDVGH